MKHCQVNDQSNTNYDVENEIMYNTEVLQEEVILLL